MKIKILLTSDVKGIGKKNDVVEVSDGYGKNFLINKKLGVLFSGAALGVKKEFDRGIEMKKEKYFKMVDILKNNSIKVKVKTGNKGEVYSHVNKEMIKEELMKIGVVDGELELNNSIKSLGEYEVKINWPLKISGIVKVSVVADK